MANPLTGDFEAVLQVSGGTINRLLASMHQNAGSNPKTPSLPHSVGIRIGDPTPVDGLRGSAWAQVGVPRIELIHGSLDRFRLQVGIRARYRPDPGTEHLPEFIHGTIRAEYILDDVDPECFGWRNIAHDYLWVRVVDGSVTFDGTGYDDEIFVVTGPTDQDALRLRIADLVTLLLKTMFAATPQKVSKPFRRGTMRSLNAPITGTAVAVPVSLSAGDPVGQISSIDNLLLEGADFAIGVSREYIMSLVQPVLTGIDAFEPTIPVSDFDTVYRVRTDQPSAEWIPQIGSAIIRFRAHGSAKTDHILLPNATFDVVQDVQLDYDAWAQGLSISPKPGEVKVAMSGVLAPFIINEVTQSFADAVQPVAADACNEAQPHLDRLDASMDRLGSQLRELDGQASAQVTQALFLRDGVILRGEIAVAPRRAPHIEFVTTNAKDAFSGFKSWVPGGEIDELAWSWSWWNGAKPGGTANWDDRFLLRRPAGGHPSTPFGLISVERPLPGLDGRGRVCLTLRGKQLDPISGELEPLQSGTECAKFGLDLIVAVEGPYGDRLFLKDYVVVAPPDRPPRPDDPLRETGLIEVATSGARTAANTLLLYLDESADEHALSSLQTGLEWCRRVDAGLLVLVLVRDGMLTAYPQLAAELHARTEALPAHAIVNEDVREGWARVFGFDPGSGEPAWRLIGPTGSLCWRRDGRLDGEELAVTLDEYLFPSPPPAVHYVASGLDLGIRVKPTFLDPSFWGVFMRPCPPPPIGSLKLATKVAFVQQESEASGATLGQLRTRSEEELLVVVIDAGDEEAAAALQAELTGNAVVIPDHAGVIADRFGVSYWPTTVALDQDGVVTNVSLGAPEADEPGPSESEQTGATS
jgi:hypothetical protein